jgi:OOP family OmpA-OmpF porin
VVNKALFAIGATAATLSLASFQAAAQVPQGNLYSGPSGVTAKNSFGQCWRASYWTPAMATMECDPDLLPKPAAAKPIAVAPPPPPPPVKPAAPAPAPAKAAPVKPRVVTVNLVGLFESGGTRLDNEARARIDKEVLEPMKSMNVSFVHIEGHTDRLGAHQPNQKLSERRADAVAAYLVSKGADKSKIETLGAGKTNQVKSCPDDKNRKALVECLKPNRRVIVEVRGMPR